MSIYTISLAAFLYLLTAIDCCRQKDYPHSAIWFAYFLANLGFIWWEIEKWKQPRL